MTLKSIFAAGLALFGFGSVSTTTVSRSSLKEYRTAYTPTKSKPRRPFRRGKGVSKEFYSVPPGTPGRKLVRHLNDECVARARAKAARRVA